jgi:hypothetical protein
MVTLATVVFALATTVEAKRPVVIAVLEEPQCKPESPQSVRVLFAKQGSEWIPLSEPNPTTTLLTHSWTVAFDGRSLGGLRTIDPGWQSAHPWTYPRDRLFGVANQRLPSVPNNGGLLAGWCGEPTRRPLVLVSSPYYRDPARWRPFTSGIVHRDAVLRTFRAALGSVARCLNEAEEATIEVAYTAADLVVVKAYRDHAGRLLLGTRLATDRVKCGGLIEPWWRVQWFLVDGRPRYLGGDMSLVDAGDYDNDGKTESLFWHSGYNEDGYTLLYDGFQKRVDYYWHYH